MPDCRYCGESFDDEAAYEDHLRDAHADELGPIDRRRLEGEDGSGLDVSAGPLILGGVVGLAGIVVAYVLFVGGGSPGVTDGVARTPTGVGSVHYHGTMNVTIAGTPVGSGDPEYVHPRENPAFHFDRVDDPRWHVHARGVTLEYAMATLGVGVSADSVTFEGTTYNGSDPGTTVVIEVDGEPVDPTTYVLREGDHVRILVRTG